MGRGSRIPWPAVNAFVEEIGAAGDDTELLRTAMRGLDRLVGMDLPCVFALINPEGRLVPERTLVASRIWFTRFRDHYWNRLPDTGTGPGRNTRAVDWARHQDTEYGADFMRPQGIRYSLGIVNIGGAPGGWTGTLALDRSYASAAFSERDQDIVEAVQPHLSNFYRLHLRHALREAELAPAAIAERERRRIQAERGVTDREWEVVGGVLRGMPNQAIAEALGISERTVEAHCVHVYTKLGVRNRRELLLLAGERGLLAAAATDNRTARR
jgi:DNA-binding CsgD family transcriptional regulator